MNTIYSIPKHLDRKSSRSLFSFDDEVCLAGMAHGYRTTLSPIWIRRIPSGSSIVTRSNQNLSFLEIFFNTNTSPMGFFLHQRDSFSSRFAKKRWADRCTRRSPLNHRLSCSQVHSYYTEYQYDLYEKSKKIASIALANGQKLSVSTVAYSNSDTLFVSVRRRAMVLDCTHF